MKLQPVILPCSISVLFVVFYRLCASVDKCFSDSSVRMCVSVSVCVCVCVCVCRCDCRSTVHKLSVSPLCCSLEMHGYATKKV